VTLLLQLGDLAGRKLSTTIDNIPGFPFKKQPASQRCQQLAACWRRVNRPKKFLGELFGTSLIT